MAEGASGVAVGPLPTLTADLRTQLQRYQGRSIFGVEGRMPISAVRVAMRAGLAAGMTSSALSGLMTPGVSVFSDPYGGGGLLRYAAVNPDVLRQMVAYLAQEPIIRGSIWQGGYTKAVHQATWRSLRSRPCTWRWPADWPPETSGTRNTNRRWDTHDRTCQARQSLGSSRSPAAIRILRTIPRCLVKVSGRVRERTASIRWASPGFSRTSRHRTYDA